MLSPTLLQPFLTSLSHTLVRGGDQQDPEAVAALLESFRPETPLQAMLTAQAIALHHAAMDCFGRAMETEADDGPTITRLQRNAASLTRAFTATLRTLQRVQTEAGKEAESAWQDPIQPEPATQPPHPVPPQSAPRPSSAWTNAQQDPMQQPAPDLRPGSGSAGAPQFMQHHDSGKDPIRREQPAQRPWEELTEAEQFAILYPDRAAAGAKSHEDADLWLPRITPAARTPAPVR
jgi:hypothetical protein